MTSARKIGARKNEDRRFDYADLDHSDGCPLLGVIVVNEPDSEPIIYLR